MLIATFICGPYLAGPMTCGLPNPSALPGMFITVGLPALTDVAVLGISQNLARIYPSYTTVSSISNPEIIADIFRIVALSAAIFLWATSSWFFCLALVSVVSGAIWEQSTSFHLVWWAFVFPNVGFTIATIQIGTALVSEGILSVGSAMTIALVAI